MHGESLTDCLGLAVKLYFPSEYKGTYRVNQVSMTLLSSSNQLALFVNILLSKHPQPPITTIITTSPPYVLTLHWTQQEQLHYIPSCRSHSS